MNANIPPSGRNLALKIEKTQSGKHGYPPDWPLIATRIKALAGWCCERCGIPNDDNPRTGNTLTVHHLDNFKPNVEQWNLAALCQRCHLRVQARVDFLKPYYRWNWALMKNEAVHSLWMARHVKGHNVWALLHNLEPIPLDRVEERDYSQEWPSVNI